MIKELAYFMCPKCFWADEDDIENRDKTHYCSRCGAVSEYWMSQKVDTVTNRVVKDEEHVETTSNTKLMICPDCGREVSRRALTCIHCGCPLTEKPEVEVKKEVTVQTPPPRKPVETKKYSHIAMPDKPEKNNVTLAVAIFLGICFIVCLLSGGFFGIVGAIGSFFGTAVLLNQRDEEYKEACKRYELALKDFERYQREEDERRKQQQMLAERQRAIEEAEKPKVTCPYCGSTDVNKISGVYKAASIGMFGVFAVPGATKQWTCRKCKSDF